MEEVVLGVVAGVVATLLVIVIACTPPDQQIKAHTTAAMGCTVISKSEAMGAVEGLPADAVFWRCGDGKVYVR